jgi:flagellar basal-body rod modification protein FlgD
MMTASVSQAIPENLRSFESTQQKEIKRTSVLGQEDFLKLLTTQLQHQDPMKPMENGEFMGQMAQFSTVSGITEMGESIDNLVNIYQGQQMSNSASMIGKQALVNGNWAQLAGGQLSGAIELPTAANDVRVDIKSETGEVMASLELGAKMAGTQEFTWDGIKDDGSAAPEANYYLSASAIRDGQSTAPAMQVYGTVQSIQLKGSEVTLNVSGQGNVSFSNVKRISQ